MGVLSSFKQQLPLKQINLYNENRRIAFNSIRSNLLRTVLTILIIAVGIMALVGILTAIDSIKASISSAFTSMGANAFAIESRGMRVHIGNKRYRTKNHASITFKQAFEFRQRFKFPSTVAISIHASGTARIKYKSYKSNPNVTVWGVDENDLYTSGKEIGKGRNFSFEDILLNRNVVMIGSEIANQVFGSSEDPIGKILTIGNGKYNVVGVLKERGTSMGGDGDRICLIPVTNVRQYFPRPNMSYKINIRPDEEMIVDIAMGEAEAIFRNVRGLSPKDETDFNLTKSDQLAKLLIDNIKFVTIAATIIGIITLFGAAVGLMNIMLVSVSERTREIGIRKAIGANSRIIKQQFLFESIIIGQMGGIVGIVFGILIGNIISMITQGPFIIPWFWILGGVLLCFFVGLASGLFPAIKASKLDPIDALRYE